LTKYKIPFINFFSVSGKKIEGTVNRKAIQFLPKAKTNAFGVAEHHPNLFLLYISHLHQYDEPIYIYHIVFLF